MANTLEAPVASAPTFSRRPSPAGIRRFIPRGDALSSSMFLLPIGAIFVALFAIPLVQTIYYSLTDKQGLSTTTHFVGFANYAKIFSDPSLLSGVGFTLLFAFSTTIIITVLAVPLAVVLNRKFVGRTFARSLFFFVGVPAQAIIGLVWQYIFSPLGSGAVNSVLEQFGLKAVPWLADSNLARFCVIFVAVWAQVGWHATLYLAYLQTVPADLYEQSEIDGATRTQQFWNITLPQLVPAVIVSTFLLITNGLKIFDLPYTMTQGGPGYATNTITQSIITEGLSQFQYGLGSALAVVFTIACVIVVLLQFVAGNAISRRLS